MTGRTGGSKEMDWKMGERRKERDDGSERQTVWPYCKIESALGSRGKMRGGDEFGRREE